jgi:hypothetical protein
LSRAQIDAGTIGASELRGGRGDVEVGEEVSCFRYILPDLDAVVDVLAAAWIEVGIGVAA